MRNHSAIFLIGSLFFASPVVAQDSADHTAIVNQAIANCEGCHGKGGDSSQATVPRLNGQQAAYIAARLTSFRDVTRQTPHATDMMWGVSTSVSDEIIASIAQYFSSQSPTSSQPSGKLSAEGQTLFLQGTDSTIPACASCHGTQGEGSGLVPRLAGQHVDYLSQQLDAFEITARVHDLMNHRTWPMTEDQITAVSAYLGRP
jgi:cytochrome c553